MVKDFEMIFKPTMRKTLLLVMGIALLPLFAFLHAVWRTGGSNTSFTFDLATARKRLSLYVSHWARSNLKDIYEPYIHRTEWQGRPIVLDSNLVEHFRKEKDSAILVKALSTGGLNVSELALFPMGDRVSAWERDLLRGPALMDPLSSANETLSSVQILKPKHTYRVGDTVTVLIRLRDGYGQPVGRGGDDVRVWLADYSQNASLSAEVKDSGTGDYTAELPLLWSGSPNVKVSLMYSAEVLRSIYFVHNILKTTRYIKAGFSSPSSSEATLCSAIPVIPGYNELCDLTEDNGGLPWYCGRPRNSALDCHHWTHFSDADFVDPLPITEAERTWFRHLQQKNNLRLIPNNLELSVIPSNLGSEIKSSLPCSAQPWTNSWAKEIPKGHFMKNIWIPRRCQMSELSQNKIFACLANTTVLLLGDSNLRLAFHLFREHTKCSMTQGKIAPRWHKPLSCLHIPLGTEIRWRPHALPFHLGDPVEWGDLKDVKSPNSYIDEIPSEGKFLIVIHLYLHLTTNHYSVFSTHIQALRVSVEALLDRNQQAQVIIRGPHAGIGFWSPAHGGDAVGHVFTSIIHREFSAMQDRVLFLQPWDMTVAMENMDFHPPDYVNKALFDLLLSHVCT